jgi:hypothetical protein
MIPAQIKDPRGERGFDLRMWARNAVQQLKLLLLYDHCASCDRLLKGTSKNN